VAYAWGQVGDDIITGQNIYPENFLTRIFVTEQ
jgi:hypothetical protein